MKENKESRVCGLNNWKIRRNAGLREKIMTSVWDMLI